MKLTTLFLPQTYIESLDKLVEAKLYPNRSEAIRIAIRDLLHQYDKFHTITNYIPPTENQRMKTEIKLKQFQRHNSRR